MSNDNLSIWDQLAATDPKHTKSFKRSGGFSGTAQNPTYAIRKMTATFGPCGIGWGTEKPEFVMREVTEGQVLVYCTVTLWYMRDEERHFVYGVGGDTVVSKDKYGLRPDDEAFKKATTDALTNAMKFLGIAADIHLGMYDDSKYVSSLRDQLSEKEREAPLEFPQIRKQFEESREKDDVIGWFDRGNKWLSEFYASVSEQAGMDFNDRLLEKRGPKDKPKALSRKQRLEFWDAEWEMVKEIKSHQQAQEQAA